ncbi:YihY/virulence factor BrkB family protein [Hellea balneolensis]|uniref:YihY/virulence factor BrkB family protein n=1 Tax=Hellea balneolensis TaxID=287478 RepID=UPI000403EFDD|nr:YihY/virulence factor BrkB family protein [Hellea balneolensis]
MAVPPPPCTARSPLEFSARDWWIISKNTWAEIHKDNVAIIAAGVAFFSLLAIFPLITACLSIYGYFADPLQVQGMLQDVNGVLPQDAWEVLNRQITAVIMAPHGRLGLGIAIGLLIALWSAGAGIRAIMRAMNIAYGERETRSFAMFYALAGSMTLSMILFVWIALAIIIGVPAILHVLKLDGAIAAFSRILPWALLISMFGFAAGILYRFGPSRRPAKKRWVFPGILFTTLTWLIISFGFSKFVAAFGNYNAIYGSLSAVIVLLIWFWLTAYTVIIGAELNAEMERHTIVDTTRGPDRPMGARGAAMADYRPEGFDLEDMAHSG